MVDTMQWNYICNKNKQILLEVDDNMLFLLQKIA